MSEHDQVESSDACIALFRRVAYAFPSAAEKRRRAQLEAERETREAEERARGSTGSNPNSRPGSTEAPPSKTKGLGALKAAAKLKGLAKKKKGG